MKVRVKTIEEMMRTPNVKMDKDGDLFCEDDEGDRISCYFIANKKDNSNMTKYCDEIIDLDEYNMFEGWKFDPFMYDVVEENEKDEKKMTNKEFYKDKLFEMFCNSFGVAVDKNTLEPCYCGNKDCNECYFWKHERCKRDEELQEWLEMEYVEKPEFKVGDEVIYKNEKYVIFRIGFYNKNIFLFRQRKDDCGFSTNWIGDKNDLTKTGRHIDLDNIFK